MVGAVIMSRTLGLQHPLGVDLAPRLDTHHDMVTWWWSQVSPNDHVDDRGGPALQSTTPLNTNCQFQAYLKTFIT